MMEKRASVRAYYDTKAEQAKEDKRYAERTAQLDALQSSLVKGVNSLLRFMDGKVTKTEIVNQLKEIATPDALKLIPVIEKLNQSVIAAKVDQKPVVDALNHLTREVTMIPAKMPKAEKPNESVRVSNLKEVVLDTKELEKAIKALKLDVKVDAPVINTESIDIKPLQKAMLDMVKSHEKMAKEMKPMESVKVSNLKDMPVADLKGVEKKLDESNKHLKVISEKKFGSSGGGGNGTPYIDSSGKPMNVVLTPSGNIPVEGTLTSAAGVTYKYYDDATDGTYDYLAKQGSNGSWWINRKAIAGGPVEYAVGSSDIATAWSGRVGLTYADWDTNNQAEAAMVTESDVHITGDDLGLAKDVTFTDLIEERVQTPTKTDAINVQIGPGDPISNIPVVMEFEHHQVHEGESYIVSHQQLTLGTGTMKYAITVPAGVYPHLICSVDVYNGAVLVNKYEGATYTGGFDMTPYNRNRNSTNTPGTTFKRVITSTDGTLFESFFAGSGKATSGGGRSMSEIILKAGTTYKFEVVGQDAQTKAVINFLWYEDLGV